MTELSISDCCGGGEAYLARGLGKKCKTVKQPEATETDYKVLPRGVAGYAAAATAYIA
jgi:hypothetical protein